MCWRAEDGNRALPNKLLPKYLTLHILKNARLCETIVRVPPGPREGLCKCEALSREPRETRWQMQLSPGVNGAKEEVNGQRGKEGMLSGFSREKSRYTF